MREDTFTNDPQQAGTYDWLTHPQPGQPPRPPQPDPERPEWDCGHPPMREDGRWLPYCSAGKNCPNGGWSRTDS